MEYAFEALPKVLTYNANLQLISNSVTYVGIADILIAQTISIVKDFQDISSLATQKLKTLAILQIVYRFLFLGYLLYDYAVILYVTYKDETAVTAIPTKKLTYYKWESFAAMIGVLVLAQPIYIQDYQDTFSGDYTAILAPLGDILIFTIPLFFFN